MAMRNQSPAMRRRFKWALGAYAAIGVLAALTLEGMLLWGVWILLGGLAVKSWIAVRREEME